MQTRHLSQCITSIDVCTSRSEGTYRWVARWSERLEDDHTAVLDGLKHYCAVSLGARAFLVGFGVFVLFVVWKILEAVARGDPNPYEVDPRLVLTILGIGGSIVGWLWMIKIGRDAGQV